MNDRARSLRRSSTDVENHMWQFLRNRRLNGYKFNRQFVIEPYIVDFICREKNIIIELDGCHHADNIAYDEERTQFLEAKGYKVLRFWNNEVFNNLYGVLQTIVQRLELCD